MESETVAIPKYGRVKEYILTDENGNTETVKIKGYRASDHELVIKLHKFSTELPVLMGKTEILREMQSKFISELTEDNFTPEDVPKNFMAMINSLNDDDYTEEEIKDLLEVVQNIQVMEGELSEISSKLGQRGLKRAKYGDDLTKLSVMRIVLAQKENIREDIIFMLNHPDLTENSENDDIIRAIINDGRENLLLTEDDLLDNLPDFDIDVDQLENIATIMIELGKPTRPLPGSGKGKQNRKL